ncbi:trypsin-like peptidase domain-containing protein [Curtobacterium sp. MCPF17_002]|uniref:S1C family serine protease n=1 Tax=Curtobacterium sp. MCPF17_002 TaxID=2175645 RepID=UPI000DA79153|nr:trypsin-like peptidase domain-containing protein [Curtobacterium sp. MCPF17_002]WIB79163.1 trypsin-like peptidase domain-containing protein [Curtobacterium sp. MCPF17_002]
MSGNGADAGGPTSGGRWTARTSVAFVACVVAVVVAGAAAGLISSRAASSGAPATADGSAGTCDAEEVARSVLPSVVTIAVAASDGGGTGSGEVIDPSGIILTNDHVIAAAGDGGTVTVQLDDGTTIDATVSGRDPRTDLAVLRADSDRRLPALGWGDSDDLSVGQPVVALGAPLGLSGTVTTGVVSALGRNVPVPTETGSTILTGAVQTDASINPGNSGGALVDCAGRLVGINTAIATVPGSDGTASSGSVGIGFAVPAAVARPVAAALRADGSVNHPTFGAQTNPVSVRDSSGALSIGLQLTAVTDGGPAGAAGLRAGDVVVAIDGVDTLHPDTISHLEATEPSGHRVQLTYLRDGEPDDVRVTLRAVSGN